MKKLLISTLLIPILCMASLASAQTKSIQYTPFAVGVTGLGNTQVYAPGVDATVDSVWTSLLSGGTIAGLPVWSARELGTGGLIGLYNTNRVNGMLPYQTASNFNGGTVVGGFTQHPINSITASVPTVTNAASGAIAIPTIYATNYLITYNSGAGAYTLAAPVAGTDDGKIIRIETLSAQAHVITSGVDGFNAKGSSGTLTFTAAIGNGCELVAYNGHWYVLMKNGVTVA